MRARRPLEVVELDVDGPKAGEMLFEIMAMGSLVAATLMLMLRKEP